MVWLLRLCEGRFEIDHCEVHNHDVPSNVTSWTNDLAYFKKPEMLAFFFIYLKHSCGNHAYQTWDVSLCVCVWQRKLSAHKPWLADLVWTPWRERGHRGTLQGKEALSQKITLHIFLASQPGNLNTLLYSVQYLPYFILREKLMIRHHGCKQLILFYFRSNI